MRYGTIIILLACILAAVACSGPGGYTASESGETAPRVEVLNADIRLALVGVLAQDDPGTLVADPGWREFVFEVENVGPGNLTVETVKLLTTDGRYVDSAATYAQLSAPPDPGELVAGHVARSATGIAVGQVIPFGGLITSTIFSAVNAYGSGSKADAKRAFYLRVLKKVELAPGGKVNGSAFLPAIPNARQVAVAYVTVAGEMKQAYIPLLKGVSPE